MCNILKCVTVPPTTSINYKTIWVQDAASSCARDIDRSSHSGYRSILALTSLAYTRAGQWGRNVPPAPIRTREMSPRLSGQRRNRSPPSQPRIFTGNLLSPIMYDLNVGYRAAFRLFISVLLSLTRDVWMNKRASTLASAQGIMLFCQVWQTSVMLRREASFKK